MVINVTPLHISSGDRWEQRSCPIALALESAGIRSPRAKYRGYDGLVNGARVTGGFPSVVAKFMEDFDFGRDVKPISFEVTPRVVQD